MILFIEWMERAACRSALDDDVFFSPDLEGEPTGAELGRIRSETSQREITAKIRYCSVCPVRRDCAALGWNQEFGVYGGWSPLERLMHDRGDYRPTKVRSKISPQRDKAVALVREGLSINDTAVKMEMTAVSVADYLRQAWALALTTESNVSGTA
jgi:hypothetical protein